MSEKMKAFLKNTKSFKKNVKAHGLLRIFAQNGVFEKTEIETEEPTIHRPPTQMALQTSVGKMLLDNQLAGFIMPDALSI